LDTIYTSDEHFTIEKWSDVDIYNMEGKKILDPKGGERILLWLYPTVNQFLRSAYKAERLYRVGA